MQSLQTYKPLDVLLLVLLAQSGAICCTTCYLQPCIGTYVSYKHITA